MQNEFDVDEAWADVLKTIDQDGYIVIEVRTMELNHVEGPMGGWHDEMTTHKFTYNETRRLIVDEIGIRIDLLPDASGIDETMFWPWASVLHYTHRSNSKDIAAALDKARKELSEVQYAEEGIRRMEQIINGEEGPHGEGCTCPPDAEVSEGYPVNVGIPNPCSPNHHVAVLTHADVWVCLECAYRWNVDGSAAVETD